MANRLLRNIAVTLGAGLAAGISASVATRKTPREAHRQVPNFTPMLTRIEDIECRVARVEHAPVPAAPLPEEIDALGTLVSSQTEDINSLRQAIERIEVQNARQAEAFGQKVALVEQSVPAHIEAAVNVRMMELEQRLRGEFQEIHHRTVDTFVEAIESRVVGRIMALESSLIEQSQSIVTLREKSVKTDDNLQRLLEAVEKLCARAEAQAHIPVLAPAPLPEPVKAPEYVETRFMPEPEPVHRDLVQPEPELAFAGGGRSYSPPPRGMKALGFALLGLAAVGLRFVR